MNENIGIAAAKPKQLLGIQYLRGIAALGVVVFHAAEKTGSHATLGVAGVDIFFIISGFIMWMITSKTSITATQFMIDRFLRIAPIYWLATFTMVIGGMVGLFPNLQVDLFHTIASLFLFHISLQAMSKYGPSLFRDGH